MRKGFTLIELLVVLAIISLLSSIVLASVNSSRVKAANAAIKANLETVKTQISLYAYDHNGTYGNQIYDTAFCSNASGWNIDDTVFADPVLRAAIQSAEANSGSSARAYCHSVNGPPAGNWMIAVPISNDSFGNYWCIDSQGGFYKVPAVYASSLATFCVDAHLP